MVRDRRQLQGRQGARRAHQALSSELLTANLAADFYLGEIVVPAAKPKGLNVILNILQRKTVIDVDEQSDGDEADGASAASAASQSGIFD